MTTTVKTAGLVDAGGNCLNAVLVHVDDDSHAVVDYTPAEGFRLIVDDAAGIGKKWNGSAFVDPAE